LSIRSISLAEQGSGFFCAGDGAGGFLRMKEALMALNTKKRPEVNGGDVERLIETMRAVRTRPEAARFAFRARNRWFDGGRNRAEMKDYYGACEEQTDRPRAFVCEMDEPPVLLGRDGGANPVEIALAALSGCLTTSLVYHAAVRGITVYEVESTYEGDIDLRGFLGMDAKIRNGFQHVRVTMRVRADADDATLDELVRMAQERSPVFDIFTNPVPVTVSRVA
jgi:uncharacterized OsmC-like protein